MWSLVCCGLVAAAGPADDPKGDPPALVLTNKRLTVGELGPPRASSKLLPGDVLFIGYDITGLTIDRDGVAKYAMAMRVIDADGKLIFDQKPRELTDFVPLGGGRVPGRAFVTVGLDQPPGAYTCKITVTDAVTKAAADLAVEFEVLERAFGIVAVYTSHDDKGAVSAPTSGFVGQTVFVQFTTVDFARDPKTVQPKVEFRFQVLDEKGAPMLDRPRTHAQDRGVPEKDGAFAMKFPVFLSRPGKFTVRIEATDKVADRTATYELPLTVLPTP